MPEPTPNTRRAKYTLKLLAYTLFGAALGGYGTYYWLLVIPEFGLSLWELSAVASAALIFGLLGYTGARKEPEIELLELGGQIGRDTNTGIDSEDVVDAIYAADHAEDTQALCLRVNSPGGAVVPSADIARAVEDFDGPTATVVTDTCASGGYMIAAATDHIVTRPGSMVGSIGVKAGMLTLAELREAHGIDYEEHTAGAMKGVGNPLTESDDAERAFFQELVDAHYDRFVGHVAEHRGLTETQVRNTEARVYLGEDAAERGLVDAIGDEEDAVEYLHDRVDTFREEPFVDESDPTSGPLPVASVQSTVRSAAHSLGEGAASRVTAAFEDRIRLR